MQITGSRKTAGKAEADTENRTSEGRYAEAEEMERQTAELLGGFVEFYDGKQKPERLLVYEEEAGRLERLEKMPNRTARLTVLRGAPGSGRRLALKNLAYASGQMILFADCAGLLRKYVEYGVSLTRMLEWKILGLRCRFCICGGPVSEEDRQIRETLFSELIRDGFSFFITVQHKEEVPVRMDCELAEIEFKPPGLKEREVLWKYFLQEFPSGRDMDVVRLAGRHSLNAGEIRQVLVTAELNRVSYGRDCLTEKDIREAVHGLSRETMGDYARQVPCVFTWEDLVAEESVIMQLKNLCNQVSYRNVVGSQWGFYDKRPYGNGICALFYGPPGTGKTMAAQVVAGELGMELFRVDMSQMSSKYIGETQKNISSLFAHARAKNVILFFDEADAFFSRRTQVRDANDRHANGEIAHLLQQLEEYEGITILATNLRNNIDDAFRRRIKMMIGFRLPDSETRKSLWKKAVPEKAPLETTVNLDFYAQSFEIAGSEIKEVMLDAAFLAAAEQEKITNRHIRAALRSCYEKYGRILSDSDFKGGF